MRQVGQRRIFCQRSCSAPNGCSMQCHNENCLSHNDGTQRIGDDDDGDDDDDGMMVVLLMMMMISNNNHDDYCNILK